MILALGCVADRQGKRAFDEPAGSASSTAVLCTLIQKVSLATRWTVVGKRTRRPARER